MSILQIEKPTARLHEQRKSNFIYNQIKNPSVITEQHIITTFTNRNCHEQFQYKIT